MKNVVRILILILLLAGGGYAWFYYQQQEKVNAIGPLKIYGNIELRDASLAFPEQERISEVLVEEGMKVEKGQILARQQTDRLKASIHEMEATIAQQKETVKKLESGNRPQEIEQARAQLESARAQVNIAQLTLKRLQKTSESGATSAQRLDDARANQKVAEAELKVQEKSLALMQEGSRSEDIAAARHKLEALQADLELLNIRLNDMTLTAPSAGIIQSRVLEVGEMAGPGKAAFTLALTDPKWVRAYIPEPMLGKVKLGMQAQVFSDSQSDNAIEGRVGFISPSAEFTPRTVATEDLRTKLVYEARIYVDDPQDILRLGMPVTVHISGQGQSN